MLSACRAQELDLSPGVAWVARHRYHRRMAPAAGSEGLLERDVELARLSPCSGRQRRAAGAVAAIEGPAGIGKTALVEALHGRAADRGVRLLRARGRVLEAGMAFAVVRQLMEPRGLAGGRGGAPSAAGRAGRFGAGALGLPGGAAPDSEFAADPRPVLAVREPGRAHAAAAHGGRCAMGRRPVAVVAGLPRAARRRTARPGGGDRPRGRSAGADSRPSRLCCSDAAVHRFVAARR